MNIIFDLLHPVDVNFFKNSIDILKSDNHNIIITYRPRGILHKIIGYELKNNSALSIGRHYSKFVSKFYGQLLRDFRYYKFLNKKNINLVVSFGASCAIASKFRHIPFLAFEDDFEYKIPFYHANWFSTRHIMPSYIESNHKNIFRYNGFKELAYLHPNYFKPDTNELKNYSLEENSYVFIRLISNISLNYKKDLLSVSSLIERLKSIGLDIVLSLEDKSLSTSFDADCIVLQEPVNDIFSLMKYALFSISSGDSVARESALLGTPVIYTGRRDMIVNKELIELECIYKEDDNNSIVNRIDYLNNIAVKDRTKLIVTDKIENVWEDTTRVILNHIQDFSN